MDKNQPREWQHRLARQIDQDDRLQLACVLHVGEPSANSENSHRRALSTRITSALLERIETFERKMFLSMNGKAGDHLDSPLTQTHSVECRSLDSLSAGARDAISQLDIIFSMVPAGQDLANALPAHASLWTIASTGAEDISSGQFGFRDMFNSDGTARLMLLETSAGGTGLVAEGILQKQFCFARSKRFMQEKSVSLILRELRRRARLNSNGAKAPMAGVDVKRRQLKLIDVASYLIRLAGNLAPKVYKTVLRKTGRRYNRWSLFIGRGKFAGEHMSRACEIYSPANEAWADPFLFRKAGSEETHVFFENYEFTTRKGKISVGRLAGDAVEYLGDPMVCPHHLSYPFVFAHNEDVYMVPECAQARQIEIWKAVDYPLKWTRHKAVMPGSSCADTTIFEHAGNWWMFTNISTDPFDDHCSELYIFQVDSPMLNEIRPHALNPVVIDARYARNAGRIATRNGKLTRLAQNNAFRYGYGFSLMEIEQLTLDEYRERCLYSVGPGFARGITSTHHMDDLDGVYVFDGLREYG